MTTRFTKAVLGTALAATVVAGALGAAAPASAHPWGYGYHGGGGAGVAVAAGLVGLAVGAAIASDHGPYVAPAPVVYAPPPPVAYAPAPVCYNAYPGYDGYCYPATYYTNIGWGFHDGWWWYGGAHYARPFVVGGWHGGYGYRGGWDHDGYRGGYAQQPQYHGGGYGGGYGGGRGGEGGQHGGWGRR